MAIRPGWSIHRNYIVWLPTLHVSLPPGLQIFWAEFSLAVC